jgi:hypothetical protein
MKKTIEADILKVRQFHTSENEQQSTIKGQSAEIAELRRMIQECMK